MSKLKMKDREKLAELLLPAIIHLMSLGCTPLDLAWVKNGRPDGIGFDDLVTAIAEGEKQ